MPDGKFQQFVFSVVGFIIVSTLWKGFGINIILALVITMVTVFIMILINDELNERRINRNEERKIHKFIDSGTSAINNVETIQFTCGIGKYVTYNDGRQPTVSIKPWQTIRMVRADGLVRYENSDSGDSTEWEVPIFAPRRVRFPFCYSRFTEIQYWELRTFLDRKHKKGGK